VTNLITHRALFSPTYLLNLVKPDIVPFDLLTPITPRRTKHEVDRMTPCGDMAICEIFKIERSVGRRLVGRSVLNILLTLISYTLLRYVRNVARDE